MENKPSTLKRGKGLIRLMWVLSIAVAGGAYAIGGYVSGTPEDRWSDFIFSHADGVFFAGIGFLTVWILFFAVRWVVVGFKEDISRRRDAKDSDSQ